MNLLSILCLALGGIILVSLGQLLDLIRYRWFGTVTSGKVVELERQEMSENDGWVVAPIVEYRVSNKAWRIKSAIAMYPALYRVGHQVPVYYFAANPGNGRVVAAREFVKWIVVAASCLLLLALLVSSQASAPPTS